MIVGDERVTTWLSKLSVIDKEDINSLTSVETSDYFILCVRPDERALLTLCLSTYVDYLSRWVNFADETDRLDLVGRTYNSLGIEMACSEDIQLIIDNLASIALSQTQIRDNVADQTTSLETKLDLVVSELADIKLALDALDPTLINQVEEILNGTLSILGGTVVSLD